MMAEPVPEADGLQSVPVPLGTLLPAWAGGREGSAELGGGGLRVSAARTGGRGAEGWVSVSLVQVGYRTWGQAAKPAQCRIEHRELQITQVMSCSKNTKPFLKVWINFPSI